MADPRQALEAQKTKLLAEAERAAAEIDRDLQELDRITRKYGLNLAVEAQAKHDTVVTPPSAASTTREARRIAEEIIRRRGRPMRLMALGKALAERGIQFRSKNPNNVLSAVLGQSDNLYSVPGQGWWVKALPLPDGNLDVRLPIRAALEAANSDDPPQSSNGALKEVS